MVNRSINSRFRHGTITCSDCGKVTRDTGAGESSLQMCAICIEAAECYNSVQDGEMEQEEFKQHLVEIGYQGKDF